MLAKPVLLFALAHTLCCLTVDCIRSVTVAKTPLTFWTPHCRRQLLCCSPTLLSSHSLILSFSHSLILSFSLNSILSSSHSPTLIPSLSLSFIAGFAVPRPLS